MKSVDFSQVHGIANVKRAIEVSLAGMHNLGILSSKGNGNSYLMYAINNLLSLIQNFYTHEGKYIGLDAVSLKSTYFQVNYATDTIEVNYCTASKIRRQSHIWVYPDGESTIAMYKKVPVNTVSMGIKMPRLTVREYFDSKEEESSISMLQRIVPVRERFEDDLPWNPDGKAFVRELADKYSLNMAGIAFLVEVARTIAFLGNDKTLSASGIAEAAHYTIPELYTA